MPTVSESGHLSIFTAFGNCWAILADPHPASTSDYSTLRKFKEKSCMSELGRFRSLSGCLYKKRLNVRDGAGNRHSRKGSNQSHKNKGHPEGWPVQVVALEAENLGKIQCH
jgi:hypothetical protein